MASAYTVLSASNATITSLPAPNSVKAVGANPNGFRLCAYPNANYSSFAGNGVNTQALEIPGGVLFYALMPYADRTVTQYSVDLLTTAWSVPNLSGGTVGSPGQAYGSANELAAALSALGGLLMISNGTVINA
jgi:hypothetical protein